MTICSIVDQRISYVRLRILMTSAGQSFHTEWNSPRPSWANVHKDNVPRKYDYNWWTYLLVHRNERSPQQDESSLHRVHYPRRNNWSSHNNFLCLQDYMKYFHNVIIIILHAIMIDPLSVMIDLLATIIDLERVITVNLNHLTVIISPYSYHSK